MTPCVCVMASTAVTGEVCVGTGAGDSWFAHLAVNQLFDVPNTNTVIYREEGGSDAAATTATLPLFTDVALVMC